VGGVGVREKVLQALEELVLAGDPEPTFDAVAARAGVSKGGLLHHFPDRSALVEGLLRRVVAETDSRMLDAAERGDAAATWLRLSVVEGPDHRTARALLSLVRLGASGRFVMPEDVVAAMARWQQAIESELSDPARALVIRLLGDGLFLATLTGQALSHEEFEAVLTEVLPGGTDGPVR
jgi:AcrR family transcriptional regulator